LGGRRFANAAAGQRQAATSKGITIVHGAGIVMANRLFGRKVFGKDKDAT
jgi:hypothetical protein